MILTKYYYLNEMSTVARSEEPLFGLGYSLDIPHNEVYTSGWQYEKPNTWGKEHLLITRPDPEYYAMDNIIKSNVLPAINVNDPIYAFDRRNYTYDLSAHLGKLNLQS